MKGKVLIKVIVNLITTCRMLGTIGILFWPNNVNKYIFLTIITFLLLTDFIDGFLARKFKVQTLYGSMMDVIADKALIIILLLPLSKDNSYIGFILLGEIIIALINTIGKLQGKYIIVNQIGKLKMWLLSFNIIIGYLYYFKIIKIITKIFIYAMNIFTVFIQIYAIAKYYCHLKKQKSNKLIKENKGILYILFDTDYYLNYINSNS